MKIHSIPQGSEAFIIADFLGRYQQDLAIISDDIQKTLDVLKFYGITALPFPAWDNLPYDVVLPSKNIIFQRLKALYEIKIRKSYIVLVSDNFKALMQKIIPDNEIADYKITLSVGDNINREYLLSKLVEYGYENSTNANNYGEFAVRGSIVDICSEYNIRIDFFGDSIEAIKEFDPDIQISIKDSQKNSVDLFSLLERSNKNNELESIFNYLPQLCIAYKNINTIDNITESIQRNYEARKLNSKAKVSIPDQLYYMDFKNKISSNNNLLLSNLYLDDSEPSKYMPLSLKNIDEIISCITQNIACKILICAYSNGSYERIIKLLQQHNLHANKVKIHQELSPGINLSLLPVENCLINDEIIIITEQALFHIKFSDNIKKRSKPIEYRDDFTINMFVIHKEYGIGQFLGLEKVLVHDAYHECLKIAYANQDKIFVPVENIRSITKYSSQEEDVKLDKLGAKSWQIRKARIKERIKLIADELIRMAAARKLKKGIVFDVKKPDYQDFCDKFAYKETAEQLAAIHHIEQDLSSGKVMDRLVCGDTGFGKTEVAMRAAFVAMQNKHQVVIIVPTTLLCQQHFVNFKERFNGFPIKILQVSRYNNSSQIKEEIRSGNADIIIGTHALFNVEFNNLSLLIIDEEHNFGVKQKEKLKQIKHDIHLLSLSATPIPRTLQMSLTGIRDLSMITTPPINRIPTSNFVMQFDVVTIKEAIMREHDRGGGVFYICPHIKNIEKVSENLAKIVPNLKIAIVHSKVNNVEKIISDFYHGEIDILIATPIVQSGLDIARANTIVIHQSELFGLTQLYQLKGRVGRSNIHAYVYFLISNEDNHRVSDIKYLASINNSFSIASYDMDNRGFGNLVGEEQSGHIKEVGMELYQQMLEDAISAHNEVEEVKVNIGISTGISDSYIQDFKLRMNLYKRLSNLSNHDEVESFAAELIDRFGPIPDETEHLLSIVKLQQLCAKIGIIKLDISAKHTKITFCNKKEISVKLLEYIMTNIHKFKILNNQQISILKFNETPQLALEIAINEITKMIALIIYND